MGVVIKAEKYWREERRQVTMQHKMLRFYRAAWSADAV